MKRYFILVVFFMLAVSGCSSTGFGCKYWVLFYHTNKPSNSYTMKVCGWKLAHKSFWDFSMTDLSGTIARQRANELLHSKAELKTCNVNDKRVEICSAAASCYFSVICNNGGPAKNDGTIPRAFQYLHND